MNKKFYLGIDLGTSSIKVSLGDEKGNIIDSASEDYPLILPQLNYSEQDPNEWYNGMIKALLTLSARNDLSKVRALSFSGQMHGLVLLDKDDKVIRNAILWNDSRTEEEVDYLNNVIGKDKLIEETGNIALCGFTAPKLLWVKKHEKENFERINKIMLPKDYLAYRLTNVFASDISDLSGTLFFDVSKKQYSKYMLDILSIKEEQLPKIYSSYDVIGHVLPIYQELVNLPSSCLVIIGGGDQAIGGIGTNTVKENTMSISLGTSGTVFAPLDNYAYDRLGRVHTFRHASGKFHFLGCTLSAMGSLKWFLEDILNTDDYVKELSSLPDEISNIIFLPYLCGERSPINDPKASGYFSNLSLYYKRGDLVKAVLEGICFSLYDVYLVMKENGLLVTSARVIGGGSKSKALLQILADIFNIEIKTINTKDGGALGALILAMVGDKLYPSIEDACSELIKDNETYYPDSKNHLKYLKKFKRYQELYLTTKPLEEKI